jgi:hypothetical protein
MRWQSHHKSVALFFFLQGLCASSWAARIPAIAQQLHLGDAALGALLFAAPLGSLMMMPWAGMGVARLGSAWVLPIAQVLQGMGVLAIGLAASGSQLGGALLAYGLANTLVQIAVNDQAVTSQTYGGGSWMATFHGMWSVGGFAGAAMAAALGGQGLAPLPHFALVCAGVVLATLFAKGSLLVDTLRIQTAHFARPSPTLIGLGLLALTAMFCETALFDWSGIYLRREAGVTAQWAGISYAGMMGAMALSRFGADAWVERTSLLHTLRLGGMLSVFGLFLAIFLPYPPIAIGALAMVGVGIAPLVPLLMGAVGRTPNMAPSIALAWASTIGFTGAMAAPPTLGFLSAAFTLRSAFLAPWGMGLLFVVGLNLRGPKWALTACPPKPQPADLGAPRAAA